MGWLRAQNNEASATLITRLEDPQRRSQMEYLPDYWDPPVRTS